MQQHIGFSSAYLLRAAQVATTREGPHDATVAIVFAALSVEASANEVAELARLVPRPSQRVRSMIAALSLAEDEHASTELKWCLAIYGLSGQFPDRGAQPLQDLELLFRLRNLIVHTKPERFVVLEGGDPMPEPPKLVAAFVSRGVILKPTARPGAIAKGASLYLLKRPVAQWALATAVACRKALVPQVGSTAIKTLLGRHFGEREFGRRPSN
jgi:hypothetical protein